MKITPDRRKPNLHSPSLLGDSSGFSCRSDASRSAITKRCRAALFACLLAAVPPPAALAQSPAPAGGAAAGAAEPLHHGTTKSSPGLPPDNAVGHIPLELRETPKLWSFEFGVGVISETTLSDFLTLDFEALDGPGSGLIYNFTVARQIKEFDWKLWGKQLRPQLEVPFRFTLVDESAEGLIPDVNLGIVLRWQNFPWNRFLYTTLAAGTGLSYSSPVWTADNQQHPGRDRSEIKFWLPIEFTVALPRYRNYQLTAFIDHQSGGHIFDMGGVDAWGFGIRVLF